MAKENWIWMPHPGHFICASECKFFLTTYVNGYIVSTVGEYFPDAPVREIIAECRGVNLVGQGDARRRDYFKKIGFEPIGSERLYETMVFKAERAQETETCCPYRAIHDEESNLDFDSYNKPEDAFKGHMEMCEKWDRAGL